MKPTRRTCLLLIYAMVCAQLLLPRPAGGNAILCLGGEAGRADLEAIEAAVVEAPSECGDRCDHHDAKGPAGSNVPTPVDEQTDHCSCIDIMIEAAARHAGARDDLVPDLAFLCPVLVLAPLPPPAAPLVRITGALRGSPIPEGAARLRALRTVRLLT